MLSLRKPTWIAKPYVAKDKMAARFISLEKNRMKILLENPQHYVTFFEGKFGAVKKLRFHKENGKHDVNYFKNISERECYLEGWKAYLFCKNKIKQTTKKATMAAIATPSPLTKMNDQKSNEIIPYEMIEDEDFELSKKIYSIDYWRCHIDPMSPENNSSIQLGDDKPMIFRSPAQYVEYFEQKIGAIKLKKSNPLFDVKKNPECKPDDYPAYQKAWNAYQFWKRWKKPTEDWRDKVKPEAFVEEKEEMHRHHISFFKPQASIWVEDRKKFIKSIGDILCISAKKNNRCNNIKAKGNQNGTPFYNIQFKDKCVGYSIQEYYTAVTNTSKPFPLETVVLALIYLDIVLKKCNDSFNDKNGKALLVTSLRVADKYLEDDERTQQDFSYLGGVSLTDLNALEKKFFELLDNNLYIADEKFNQCKLIIFSEIVKQSKTVKKDEKYTDTPARLFPFPDGLNHIPKVTEMVRLQLIPLKQPTA